jgi:hypothetical protein
VPIFTAWQYTSSAPIVCLYFSGERVVRSTQPEEAKHLDQGCIRGAAVRVGIHDDPQLVLYVPPGSFMFTLQEGREAITDGAYSMAFPSICCEHWSWLAFG